MTTLKRSLAFAAALALALQLSFAGPLRERWQARQAYKVELQQQESLDDGAGSGQTASLPAHTRVLHDVAYGADERQRIDVYLPERPQAAPLILMVHGGGWFRGDKAMHSVVDNKVARWVPKGFIVVSANYRMVPQADPLEQARDVARALAAVQDKAAAWGGDPRKVILIGHSAGAHLVALLAADRSLSSGIVGTPWLGTVALDSAAFDVDRIMQGRHMRLYDRAFGSDPAYWKAASPYHALTQPAQPILAVCSSRREDSCAQAARFVQKATSLGGHASVLQEDFSHREINEQLGKDPAYTQAVELFMAGLDPAVAQRLSPQ